MSLTLSLTLPRPLVSEWSRYCADRFPDGPFRRKTLAAVNARLPGFENNNLFVSSPGDYLRLVSFVFSKDTGRVWTGFNDSELDALRDVTDSYGAERSKLYSLFLCSFVFSSGASPIPAGDFLSCLSGKPDYAYQLLVTADILKLHAGACRRYGPLSLTALIRAAVFYFRFVAPGQFHVTEEPEVTVTGASAGWKKFFVRGSNDFKNCLFDMKRSTGKPVGSILGNAAYRFLLAAGGGV
jgi:hypothetical protein